MKSLMEDDPDWQELGECTLQGVALESGSLAAPAKRLRSEEQVLRNRAIQAAYRARKKEKAASLAARHQAACDDMERARQESLDLQHHGRAIEAVLALREDWSAALDAAKAAGAGPVPRISYGLTISPRWANLSSPLAQTLLPNCALVKAIKEHASHLQKLPAPASHYAEVEWQDVTEGTAAAEPASPPGTPTADDTCCAVMDGGDAAGVQRAGSSSSSSSSSAGGGGGGGGGVDPIEAVAEQLEPCSFVKGEDGAEEFNPIKAVVLQGAGPEVVEQVKSSTYEQFQASWLSFVTKARELLTQYDITKSQALLSSIETSIERWALVVGLMFLHKPTNVQRLMAADLQGGGEPSDEERAEERRKWDEIAADLDPSPEVRAHYKELYETYRAQLRHLQEHKDAAVHMMLRRGTTSEGPAVRSLADTTRRYLDLWEGTAGLSAFSDLQFVAALELQRAVSQNMTPLQRARVVVAAGPNFPDFGPLLDAVDRSRRMDEAEAASQAGSAATLSNPHATASV